MKTVKLSNGDQVSLKPYMTRGLQRTIHQLTFGDTKVNVKDAENVELDMSKVLEVEDVTVLQMIESITTSGNKEIVPAQDYLDKLSVADFETLKVAVNEITNPANPTLDEKKSQ